MNSFNHRNPKSRTDVSNQGSAQSREPAYSKEPALSKKLPVEDPELPIEIALEKLSAGALDGIIQSFILREGTDYGLHEASYELKSQQVLRQLQRGDIKIVFDLNSESLTMLSRDEFRKKMKRAIDHSTAAAADQSAGDTPDRQADRGEGERGVDFE